jgi:hypothetical protein
VYNLKKMSGLRQVSRDIRPRWVYPSQERAIAAARV